MGGDLGSGASLKLRTSKGEGRLGNRGMVILLLVSRYNSYEYLLGKLQWGKRQ